MTVIGEEGTIKLLLGNEAIARGAIEAGVHLVTGYPGTPSTEVIETLAAVAKEIDMRVQWAVNEKVAFEVASGVAWTGLRAMATMKNAGLNVASDSVLSIAYSGTEGGLILYVADDPATHAGMAEQDDRLFAKFAALPMLEPSDPQESKDMVIEAFEISEKNKVPVMLRSTTNTAHMFGNVVFGPVKKLDRVPDYSRDIRRYTKAGPAWCMEQHATLLEKMKNAGRDADKFNLLELTDSKMGVITAGAPWNLLKEATIRHDLKISTLKIGVINPLPEEKIRKLIESVDSILILEELEPLIEDHVLKILGEMGKRVKVHGKIDGTTSPVGEFNQAIVESALSKLLGKNLTSPVDPEKQKLIERAKSISIRRPITFCAGCPHMGTYISILRAMRKLKYKREDVIITGDIGCTILGMNPPFDACWTEVAMGASIGLGNGFERSGIKKPVIAAIGDSTFYHAGIPALIDAVWNQTKIVVAIMDNSIVAMTGHQPTPGSGFTATGGSAKIVKVEEIARGCGVEHVVVVDPYDVEKTTEAFVEALKYNGPSVIVLRRLCAIIAIRRKAIGKPLVIDLEKCTGCMTCVKTLSCSALVPIEGKVKINPDVCIGCHICAAICPVKAITEGPDHE
ncbi:MAG: indolepyruvate ferredoxin oxidoreductase subunit alpha [Candidatus Hadarchaeaceae archaeon]